MKWFKRVISGNAHHEYRSEENDRKLLEIEIYSSGSIRLYDLRDMPATYYVGFKNLRHAKKIAVQSIDDVSVLKPFYDKEWYEMSDRQVKLIERVDEMLKNLKLQ